MEDSSPSFSGFLSGISHAPAGFWSFVVMVTLLATVWTLARHRPRVAKKQMKLQQSALRRAAGAPDSTTSLPGQVRLPEAYSRDNFKLIKNMRLRADCENTLLSYTRLRKVAATSGKNLSLLKDWREMESLMGELVEVFRLARPLASLALSQERLENSVHTILTAYREREAVILAIFAQDMQVEDVFLQERYGVKPELQIGG